VTEDLDVTVHYRVERGRGEQGGRLAGAVRPEQGDDLPGINMEIEAAHDGTVVAGGHRSMSSRVMMAFPMVRWPTGRGRPRSPSDRS
jgi:hypothetical protein